MTVPTVSPTAVPVRSTARTLGLWGAGLQLAYGALAAIFPYPTIVDPQFEALWALINVGAIATVVAWLTIGAGRPRWLGLAGGALAITGLSVRIVVSVVFIAVPDSSADWPVVVSIMLTFTGLALLGIAALRGRPRSMRWAPLLVLGVGVATASLYGPAPVAHFIALGLAWGATWMLMAAVSRRSS